MGANAFDRLLMNAVYTLGHVRGIMRATPLSLFSFCLFLSGAQLPESHVPPKPLLISVDEPAFLGEPIWVNEKTRPTPYSIVGGECSRLELLHDGKPVPPWPVKPVFLGL